MPPRKQVKCKPVASRNKKCSPEKSNKKQQKAIVSVQRLKKPRKHFNQWNYVTHTENGKVEDGEEDTFGLSPAYLCECTIQTLQETPVAPNKPSEAYCSNKEAIKTNPLKRKEHPIKGRIVKNTDLNNHNHEFSPAYLCESVLQKEDNSMDLEPDPFTGVNSNNSLLAIEMLKHKKQISYERYDNHKKCHNQDQEASSGVYKSKPQDISKASALLKIYNSNNRLLQCNPSKKRRLPDNRKQLFTNEEKSQIHEYSPAFLCESIIPSEETSLVSEPNPSKGNRSKSRKLAKNPPMTKPERRRKKQQNSKINCETQQNCLKKSSKSTVKLPNLSGISESEPSKETCSTTNFYEENLPVKTKPQRKNKKIKNSGNSCKPQEDNSDVSKITAQLKDTARSFQSDRSKENCSKNNLPVQNLCNNTTQHHKRKKPKNIEINNKTQRNHSKNNSKNTAKSVATLGFPGYETSYGNCPTSSLLERNTDTKTRAQNKAKNLKSNENQLYSSQNLSERNNHPVSVFAEFDPSKRSCLRNRFSGRKLLNKKKSQSNRKKLKNKKVKNKKVTNKNLQKILVIPIEKLRQAVDNCVISESNPPKDHNSHCKYNPQLIYDNTMQSKRSDVITDYVPTKEDCFKDCSSGKIHLKNKELFCNQENGEVKNLYLRSDCTDEVIHQEEKILLTLESNLSKEENSSKNISSEKCPANNKETVNSDEVLADEEVNFIDYTLLTDDSEYSDTSELIHYEIEEDPLELKEFHQPKDADSHKRNQLETTMTQNRCKVWNLYSDQQVGHPEGDLFLECTSEDELLDPGFQHPDCGSDETYVLGSVSPSFGIPGAQPTDISCLSNIELLCTSDTMPMFSINLKVTSATMKTDGEDKSKVDTKPLEIIDQAKLLANTCEENNSLNIGITLNQNQVHHDIFHAQSKENETRKNHADLHYDFKSNPLDLGISNSTSIQDQIIKADLTTGNKNKCDVQDVLEMKYKVETTELISPKKLEQKEQPEECSWFMKFPIELKYHPHEDNQTLSRSDSVKTEDSVIKKEEDEQLFSPPLERTSNTKYERTPLETLPTSGFFKDSKEMRMNFHEVRVLKVLLRRLEDEEVFKLWKKEGVVPLLKHSSSKAKQDQKKANLFGSTIQKSLKTRRNYKCWVCKRSFVKRDRYWEHRASKCDRVRVFGCGNCNRKYILKKMLDDHKAKCISIKYYRCKVCLKLFSSQERLDEHIASKCDTLDVFRCDVCNRSFIFKRLLLIHTTPICTSLRRYRCSICNQAFGRTQLKTHKLKEHRVGLYPTVLCEYCGKLISRGHFSDHARIHSDNPLYQCKVCPRLFQTQKARQYHYEQYHHLETKPSICADCGKAFIQLSDLKKHVTGIGRSFKCNTCGKVLQNQLCYRVHVSRHVKVEKENCAEDGLMFVIKKEPCSEDPCESSQWIIEEKPFKCGECEEIFTEKINLDLHLQSVHQSVMQDHGSESKGEQSQGSSSNTRPFKCNRCSCCYSRKERLIQHVQEFHYTLNDCTPVLNGKPFKCDICGIGFSTKMNLSRHNKRAHHGPTLVREVATSKQERPFSCDICQTYFKDKKILNRHLRRTHRMNSYDDFTIPCAFCDEKFSTDAQFREHTFEHLKNCFSVTASVKEEEHLFANTEVKSLMIGSTSTQEQPFIDTNVKPMKHIATPSHKQLFGNPDVETFRHVPATPSQEQLFTETDVKPMGNDFIFQTQEQQFASTDVEPLRNDVITLVQEQQVANNDVKPSRNVATPTLEQHYICDICGKRFGKKENLRRHRKHMHFKTGPLNPNPPSRNVATPTLEQHYICDICGKRFGKKENLRRHRKHMHLKTGPLNPNPPSRNVATPTLEQHYICDICGKRFGKKENLRRHRKHMHFKTEPLNPSPFIKKYNDSHYKDLTFEPMNEVPVDKTFKQEENLLVSTVVKEEQQFICNICGNSFQRMEYLNRHHKRMHSFRPLNPPLLGNEKIQNDSDSKDHSLALIKNEILLNQNVKNDENLLLNNVAKKDSNLLADSNYFGHQVKASLVNQNLKEEENMPVSTVAEEDRNLLADNNFGQPVKASQSNDIENFEDAITPDELSGSFNELQIGLGLNPSNLLEEKSKVNACTECGKIYNSRHLKMRHVCAHKLNTLQSTTGREVHACEQCGIVFVEKWKLNKHLLSHGPLSFKCETCKKCFNTQLKLNVHMLVHGIKTTAVRAFPCLTCNKLFASNKKLQDHMNIHSDQSPYQCTKCNRKFTSSFSLKRHNINKHAERRFLCSYCNMCFVSFSSLNQHVMNVHQKAVSLTEYILRIDEDDLQDQTPVETDFATDNLQDAGTPEVNLQPQFANLSNLATYSSMFNHAPLQSENQPELRQESVNM